MSTFFRDTALWRAYRQVAGWNISGYLGDIIFF